MQGARSHTNATARLVAPDPEPELSGLTYVLYGSIYVQYVSLDVLYGVIMVPKTERFEMRLEELTLERVDAWRAEQVDLPSRSEAIRRLVELGLARDSRESSGSPSAVTLSQGERLITLMLCDLYEHFKIPRPGINAALVQAVLHGGHSWALEWEMPGVFHGHEDNRERVTFALDVLDLWDYLERANEGLSSDDKAWVAKEAEPFGERVKFPGFDGNNEAELMSISRFLVEDLGRFARFKGRPFNSHAPMSAAYQRMLAVFKPLQRTLTGTDLSAAQMIEILGAMRHPESAKRRPLR
jgi:uncharacterized protein